LPAAAKVSAVVWSFDRNAERYDANTQAREVRVESSSDGQTWTGSARKPVQTGDLHGQVVPLSPPAEARFVRLRFFDSAGRPAVCPCDEVEAHD
jgi:hypothetical protein